MHETLDTIFQKDGILNSIKDDYIPRPSQIDAAHQIHSSLNNVEHFILEGPCGFGKTLSYLVPLFEYLHNHKKECFRAVVVTNGISLQEQLFHKDIPLVQKIFKSIYSKELNFSMLKGRQNYVCVKKMDSVLAKGGPRWQDIVDWYKDTKTGDLSELNFVPDKELLGEMSSLKDKECSGKRCVSYGECFYQKQKVKAQVSDIIITNYHLLFTDLEIGNNILLPKYNIMVFDEAHEIASIYRDFNEEKISLSILKAISKDYTESYNLYREYLYDGFDELEFETKLLFEKLTGEGEKYFEKYFDLNFKEDKLSQIKILNENLKTPDDNLSGLIYDISSNIEDIINKNSELLNLQDNEYMTKHNNNLSSILRRLKKIDKAKSQYMSDNEVCWVEKMPSEENKSSRISVNKKIVNIGKILSEKLYKRDDLMCIFTSATLSAGGSFDFIKEELGIDLCVKSINEFIGDSPFDLTNQQLWYLHPDCVDGNDRDFDKVIPNIIKDIVMACNGGALTLFTSIKNMNDVFLKIKKDLNGKGITVLKQGLKPRMKLLEEFKENVDSTLFATKSFFTGIDVVGESLRCVIIDKLPFPSPTDPVMIKLGEKPNAFFKYFIPIMIIALKQAVGRGVRSIDDKCIVAILDNRLATAKYKKKINNSFNYPKTGTRDLNDIKNFLFKIMPE